MRRLPIQLGVTTLLLNSQFSSSLFVSFVKFYKADIVYITPLSVMFSASLVQQSPIWRTFMAKSSHNIKLYLVSWRRNIHNTYNGAEHDTSKDIRAMCWYLQTTIYCSFSYCSGRRVYFFQLIMIDIGLYKQTTVNYICPVFLLWHIAVFCIYCNKYL